MATELLVKLPDELKAFYRESGYLPTTAVEYRTNARLRVRSDGDIKFTFTPAALTKNPEFRQVREGKALIKDLSKGGIGVLYHEQIFPEERFQLFFQGRIIEVTVVRCRRLNEACYEIGGRVIEIRTLQEYDDDDGQDF